MGGFMKNINHLKLGDLVNFQTGPLAPNLVQVNILKRVFLLLM